MTAFPGRGFAPGALLLALGLLTLVAGCQGDGRPERRLGCLPCPGLFSGYELADPENLGVHHYERGMFDGHETDEVERGLLYTCHAGFIDLAHLRETVDWTRYMSGRVKPALRAGRPGVLIDGRERTRYRVRFAYPDDWDAIPASERGPIVDELAIRIGQQLAYVVVTWHEIITWYGFKSTGIWPEDQSAFTYEDVTSHVVGLHVADAALRRTDCSFDQAATEALDAMLRDLGVVAPETAEEATQRVKDLWWVSPTRVGRHLDIGFHGSIRPWIVAGLEGCGDAEPAEFTLPTLDGIAGRDFSGMFEVFLESKIYEIDRIREVIDPPPPFINPAAHFPILLASIRQEMIDDGLDVAGAGESSRAMEQ